MRIVSLLLLLAFSLSIFSARAEIYRWVDAQGRVMYGDDPPTKSRAKQVELPTLTVADGFAPKKQQEAQQQEEDEAYSDFKIASPAAGDTVRTTGGNLTVSINLKPKLKDGDGITLYLDSKQVASGSSLSFQLNEVERGEHTAFAVLNDTAGNIIQNTETVKFNVLQYADAAESDSSDDNTGDANAYKDAQDRLQNNMYGTQPTPPSADTTFSFPSLPNQ